MSTLVERLDRFVRWFFNSSPDFDLIQPTPERAKVVGDPAPARTRSSTKKSTQAHRRTRFNRIHA